MKALIIISSAILISLCSITAQETASFAPTKQGEALSFSPQYLTMGAMRIDYDRQMTKRGWLTIAPAFYYVENSYMWDPDKTSFKGAGAFANYRFFPSGSGIYVLCGINYRYLDVSYTKEYNYFGDESDESVDSRSMQANTWGFDMSFGYQFLLAEQFFLDMYLGWGFRYSTENSIEDKAYWSDAILDLAYSGFLPVAGLRLGFEF